MYIKELNIDAFGTIRNRTICLTLGLNIIEGENESGKSATAMFIKFMLYGLSGKSSGGEMTERRRYVNWDTGTASGSMTVVRGESEYRIERTLAVSLVEDGGKARESVRESVRMIDVDTNTVVHKGEVPGEVLFGVPEDIFMNTVFVRQIDGARINSTGILSSIENLLFTANETISTKKALERLDDERRRILHKNGSGGVLHEKRTERSGALSALREAETNAGTLTTSEAELEKAKERCAQLHEKIESQSRVCRYGELNLIKRRFDTAAVAEKKLGEMRDKIKQMEARSLDPVYLSQLTDAKARILSQTETMEKLKAARAEAHAQWKIAYQQTGEIQSETEEAATLAASLKARCRAMTAVAIILIVLALGACVGAWLMYKLAITLYTLAIAAACALAALGLLCFVLRGKAKKSLLALLAEWDAANAADLPDAILKKHGDVNDPEMLKHEKQRLDDALAQTIKQRRTEADNAYTLAARAVAVERGETPNSHTDPEAEEAFITGALAAIVIAYDEAERHCDAVDALRSDADALRGRLSVLQEQLAGKDEAAIRETFAKNMETPEGRIASGIDAARLDAARAELEKAKRAYAEAQEEMHRLDSSIAAARAVSVSPAQIADKITALDTEIEELTKRHEAYCLAIDTLKGASESMRASVLPRVVSEACASANRFAGGSFDAIGVDESLAMNFTRGGQTREVEYLSEGTKDIAYVSLRRALSSVLFDGVRPPLIYDESFARVDETRLGRILALLASREEVASQSILLSCHRREAAIAEKLGEANIVYLS